MSSSKLFLVCFLSIQLIHFDALFSMEGISTELDWLRGEKEFDCDYEHSDPSQLLDLYSNNQEVSAWSPKTFVEWSSTESNMDVDSKKLFSHPTQIFSSLKKNIDSIESLSKEKQKEMLILFGAFIFMLSMDICSNPERDDPDTTDMVVAFIRSVLATLERKHNSGHSLPRFSELRLALLEHVEKFPIEKMEYEPSWVVSYSESKNGADYCEIETKYNKSDLRMIKKVRMWAKKIFTSFVQKATRWEDLID